MIQFHLNVSIHAIFTNLAATWRLWSLSFFLVASTAEAMCAFKLAGIEIDDPRLDMVRFVDLTKYRQHPELIFADRRILSDLLKDLEERQEALRELALRNSATGNVLHTDVPRYYREQETSGAATVTRAKTKVHTDIQLTRDLLESLRRLHLRQEISVAPGSEKVAKMTVTGKEQEAILREILATGAALNKPHDQILIHRFAISRHDLAEMHGTDRHGRSFEDIADEDQMSMHEVLAQRNLKAEDGFYAITLEEAMRPSESEWVQEFMNGEQGLAIYDANQMEDKTDDSILTQERITMTIDDDITPIAANDTFAMTSLYQTYLYSNFFVFKNRFNKRDALLKVILPVR